MKKSVFLLLIPLLIGCSSVQQARAEADNEFIATDLLVSQYNQYALQYRKSLRGVEIKKAENMTSTDAFLRFDQINQTYAVKVQTHKFIAIRYRANYEPQFALRIKSTTDDKWSDFRFSDDKGHDVNEQTWSTYVCPLSFKDASSVTESEYNKWETGDYLGVSFNIVNSESFILSNSHLYISSFAFFTNEEDANEYKGLDYTRDFDTEGPNITIPFGDGETFDTTAGKYYEFYADAYDEFDDIHSTVSGELSAGALDENGKFVEGNHTVTFKATDFSGNTTTKVLNLTVRPKDTIAPVINCDLETIYVPTGTYNCLSFVAVDEEDGEIQCEYEYSEGAVDEQNRFLKGNHTLTITAKDLTGNTATKNVSIVVSDDLNPNGLEVIEEEK